MYSEQLICLLLHKTQVGHHVVFSDAHRGAQFLLNYRAVPVHFREDAVHSCETEITITWNRSTYGFHNRPSQRCRTLMMIFSIQFVLIYCMCVYFVDLSLLGQFLKNSSSPYSSNGPLVNFLLPSVPWHQCHQCISEWSKILTGVTFFISVKEIINKPDLISSRILLVSSACFSWISSWDSLSFSCSSTSLIREW